MGGLKKVAEELARVRRFEDEEDEHVKALLHALKGRLFRKGLATSFKETALLLEKLSEGMKEKWQVDTAPQPASSKSHAEARIRELEQEIRQNWTKLRETFRRIQNLVEFEEKHARELWTVTQKFLETVDPKETEHELQAYMKKQGSHMELAAALREENISTEEFVGRARQLTEAVARTAVEALQQQKENIRELHFAFERIPDSINKEHVEAVDGAAAHVKKAAVRIREDIRKLQEEHGIFQQQKDQNKHLVSSIAHLVALTKQQKKS